MLEWWTYSLSDFLMFAPRTYYRLVGIANAQAWPLQVFALAAGAALLAPAVRRSRLAAAILAIAWAWVAWAWLLRHYATINWAAEYFAIAFLLQAALLAAFALRSAGPGAAAAPLLRRLGTVFVALALAGAPLASVLAGRGLETAEVFGLTPDPTVLATLGVVATTTPVARAVLLPIPLAWCAIAGATLWTMDAPEWWVMPLAGATVLGAVLAVGVAGGARAR